MPQGKEKRKITSASTPIKKKTKIGTAPKSAGKTSITVAATPDETIFISSGDEDEQESPTSADRAVKKIKTKGGLVAVKVEEGGAMGPARGAQMSNITNLKTPITTCRTEVLDFR